jgi:pyridoxal phosphate enzyme (YggS family)
MSIIENYNRIYNLINVYKNKTKLIIVTKNQDLNKIKLIINQGHMHFGENRVREAKEKWSKIVSEDININLHLVGKLQSNKSKEAHNLFDYIHSLDNEKLAKSLSLIESSSSRKIKYFVQVNIGNEPQKNGLEISLVKDFVYYCKNELKLNIIGLMCIPPLITDPTNYFLQLKKLAEINNLQELSMGMSNDFEKAIKCGATFVRVGSSIFNES